MEIIGQRQPRNQPHYYKHWGCEPHGRAVVLGSLTLLHSTQAPLPNKVSCIVITVSPQTIPSECYTRAHSQALEGVLLPVTISSTFVTTPLHRNWKKKRKIHPPREFSHFWLGWGQKGVIPKKEEKYGLIQHYGPSNRAQGWGGRGLTAVGIVCQLIMGSGPNNSNSYVN